jgi:hypothetical protein
MRTILALASLLACLISTAYATALTYRLEAHEKACYFAQVEHKGTKLAFYFAVCSGGIAWAQAIQDTTLTNDLIGAIRRFIRCRLLGRWSHRQGHSRRNEGATG